MDTTNVKDWADFLSGFHAAHRGEPVDTRQGYDWKSGWLFYFHTTSDAALPSSDRVGALH